MTEVAGGLGFDHSGAGKALVVLDFDSDGDEDVMIATTGSTPALYRNDGGNRSHWIQVGLVGTTVNRLGLGAWVEVNDGGVTQIREMGSRTGFLGTSEPMAHFGLGNSDGLVDAVTIYWPAGPTQVLNDVPANSRLTVVQP